jgi:DNA-binding CsgD family transcriptional regulator
MTSVAWRTSEDSWVSGSDRIPSNGTAAGDADLHLELDHLTGREGEVVRAAMDGRTNQEIADSLGISVRTVKHHLTSVFRKSGVRNRTELVRASLVSSAQT